MRAFAAVVACLLLSLNLSADPKKPKIVPIDFEKDGTGLAQGQHNLRVIPSEDIDKIVIAARTRYMNRIQTVYDFEIPE